MQKLFGGWGHAPGPPGGAGATAAVAAAAPPLSGAVAVPQNGHRGKHDAVLGHLLEKHEGKPELMIDTLLDFINRSTDFFSGPGGDGGDGGDGDGAQKLAAVCGRFADFLGMVGGAAASGGSEFAARLAAANAAARAAVADIDEEQAPESAAPAAATAPSAEADEEQPVDVPITRKAAKVELPIKVSKSAQAALERFRASGGGGSGAAASKTSASGKGPVAQGTKCLHKGCEATYRGERSERETCVYHPGNPVFHEGFKFWSCCERTKVTDFSEFLSIRGCTEGKHCFRDEAAEAKAAECRADFFQQGPSVVYNVYAKRVDPELSCFSASKDTLTLKVSFDGGSVFEQTIKLAGRVDATRSAVEIKEPKVEITMHKADGANWKHIGKVV